MQWEGKNGPTRTKLLVNARVNCGANPNHLLIAPCTATLDVSNGKLIRKDTNSKVSKLKSFRNLCRNWAPAKPNLTGAYLPPVPTLSQDSTYLETFGFYFLPILFPTVSTKPLHFDVLRQLPSLVCIYFKCIKVNK